MKLLSLRSHMKESEELHCNVLIGKKDQLAVCNESLLS